MSLPEQEPMSKRRLRGTKFYILRNYYSLAILGGLAAVTIPLVLYTNFLKNVEKYCNMFSTHDGQVEKKKLNLSHNVLMTAKEKATMSLSVDLQSGVTVDLDKFDQILKETPAPEDL